MTSIKVYNNSVFDFINKDFEIETLDNQCQFTEGPVWNKEGFYLVSDIVANCIYKFSEGKPKEIFLTNSGTNNSTDPDLDLERKQIGSNALAYDHDGNLLICQHGNHGIAKWDGKNLSAFISQYNGKPFNSPNDFILHKNGRIYFSDPPYGLKDGKLNPAKFQPLAGVYCWQNGALQLICNQYQYPNGVCLSNDQKTLYICSSKPFEKFISLYNTDTNQFIKIFAEENSDGIEVDRNDNVYLCTKEGIVILNTKGERLALIAFPTIPANICWGGKNFNDLFVASRQNIFLIKNLQK